MMQTPTLRTGRLILRGHGVDDLDAVFALWGNPAVVEHITGKPLTREESWSRLLRYVGHWRLLGFGCWAVEEKDTGRFVGDVGLANWERDIVPSLRSTPEMGWVLDPSMHGKGYATEAVEAVHAWCEGHLPVAATACIVAPENHASRRVAQKCGYREFARAPYRGHEVIVFRREIASAGAAVGMP